MRFVLYVAAAALLFAAVPSTVVAKNAKFVGIWEGISGPVYTKLIIHPDETVTYCYVQSCRQQGCWKLDYQGSVATAFHYANDLGAWEFKRIGAQAIEGKFTNLAGNSSHALYRPE